MKEKEPHAPRWAQRLVEWYCKPELAEDLLGDLNEYFERNVGEIGARRARMTYAIDAFKFFRTYTVRKPKIVNLFISWIMIGSYIKTSGRNVMRNKLFSSINIIGLAISMSVGLLMIAFLHDLFSYDRFNENYSQIYRVVSSPTENGQKWNDFASTSVKAGRLIQEKVSQVEVATIIRQSFDGDAKIGDNIVPVAALWAEPSFFKVFTFPMIKGDPATALEAPYSIVLTEKTAKKIFGDQEAFGKSIRFDTLEYQVTGILKDIPFFSHLQFESLISFSTIELQSKKDDRFLKWSSMWQNYVYMLLPEKPDLESLQANFDLISKEQNEKETNWKLDLKYQTLGSITLGKDLSNNFGAGMPVIVVWIIGGLAAVVILSACFNYTNLSIARSLRRFKEVGLRKVIGAGKNHVRQQFLYEAVIVSTAALLLSFFIFLALRQQFLNMAPELQAMVKLEITPIMVGVFILFAVMVGVIAGMIPAIFFAKVSIIQALKDTSGVKVFRHVSMRRALVVIQYTLTLIFITTTVIGYDQYKSMLAFDLGFKTDNVLNIKLLGNKPETFVKELSEIPEVQGIAKSVLVTSTGRYWGGNMSYKDKLDSADVWYNIVDENYFPMHEHAFLAGQNFKAHPTTKEAESEVIVNEKVLKRFAIGSNDPSKAIGEEIRVDGKSLTIVGVLKDFHYGKVDNKIDPVIFRYWIDQKNGYVNLKIRTSDPVATMAKVEQAWKSIDRIHPLQATFYKDDIEQAYNEFSAMIKVIGFLSFLAISIASLGMFGMVVFTTETRLKEISIRKIMGASSGNLMLLLSRGFIFMLGVSAIIALPATYFLFEGFILLNFPYHNPVGFIQLSGGLFGVLIIAVLMIASQTLKAAKSNPAEVLKNE